MPIRGNLRASNGDALVAAALAGQGIIYEPTFLVSDEIRAGRLVALAVARGNQWTNGGAGCAEWTGIPLAELLKAAGVQDTVKYTAHYGANPHLSGDTSKESL